MRYPLVRSRTNPRSEGLNEYEIYPIAVDRPRVKVKDDAANSRSRMSAGKVGGDCAATRLWHYGRIPAVDHLDGAAEIKTIAAMGDSWLAGSARRRADLGLRLIRQARRPYALTAPFEFCG